MLFKERKKIRESVMLSLEVEEDLGLGSKKVETLDTFNPVFL